MNNLNDVRDTSKAKSTRYVMNKKVLKSKNTEKKSREKCSDAEISSATGGIDDRYFLYYEEE